jgi:hypothetical protein
MPRKPTIKWRNSDTENLEREIKRFNNKIYHVRNRHPELTDILPDTITKADKQRVIEQFKDLPRSEFNKYINSLDRFVHKGAEKQVVSKTGNRVTHWEKNEVSLKVAQINRERAIERKAVENMDATSRGQSLGMKRGEMGSERLNELKPKKFNFDKIRGGKEWEHFKESVERQASPKARDERLERYKDNYIKGLQSVFGDYANDIIDIIKELPAKTVVDTYYSEQEATIEFFYDPQSMDTKLEILNDIWQGVADELNETDR